MLAAHPQVKHRVLEEVDAVKELTFDVLQNMSYLHKVINETLRLYPPIPETDKTNTKDTYIGDYFVPKGVRCIIVLLTL